MTANKDLEGSTLKRAVASAQQAIAALEEQAQTLEARAEKASDEERRKQLDQAQNLRRLASNLQEKIKATGDCAAAGIG